MAKPNLQVRRPTGQDLVLAYDPCNGKEADFIGQVSADAAPDELECIGAQPLADIAKRFWQAAETYLGPAPRLDCQPVKLANGPGAALTIIQPDAPFLVDSVMAAVAQTGAGVQALFHPVIAVARDRGGHRQDVETADARRESMILILLNALDDDQVTALLAHLALALTDVYLAVGDHGAMLGLMQQSIRTLEGEKLGLDPDDRAETLAFLEWLAADHFVFLGARVYEYPRTKSGDYAAEEPLIQPQSGLGILRDEALSVLRRTNEPAILSPQIRRDLEAGEPLTVAKSNLRSRIHRPAHMDYIGIKRFGPDGRAFGEVRFVGLFTVEAYDQPTSQVPLIRRKVARVLDQAGKLPGSHSEKRLRSILETYPRDELFQIPLADLTTTALGILHLTDRPRVKLFVRHDPFDRFVSALLFIPRDRYNEAVARAAGQALAQAFAGRVSATYPSFSDAPLARVHYIVGLTPGQALTPDLVALEAEIAEHSRPWSDRFEAAVRGAGLGSETVQNWTERFTGAFPAGYCDLFSADEAVDDLKVMADMAPDSALRVRAYRRSHDATEAFRLKLYHPQSPIALADVLPLLQSMGLKALSESGFIISPQSGAAQSLWVHEFVLHDPEGARLRLDTIKAPLEAALLAIWSGQTECDGFNRLVLELGLAWREVALIRCLARYRQQSGLDPSQAVQEAALCENPGLTGQILDLFNLRFDPGLKHDAPQRTRLAKAGLAQILDGLQQVESLDHDRVLRRLAHLVMALTRTNYFQTGPDGHPKPYISVKIASRDLDDLPAPKPFREIYVWSPRVEGVHLRFGPVARGGLRWSDRRDDFRTEVLGLVKAQQVKNAVIVPVGSKGGFFPKALPREAGPDAVRDEAIRAYKIFLAGLLDLTDNLAKDGAVIHPAQTLRYDADDPYLVVAADKGTATFSDIANSVAADYGFWLGDAFASGGSVGYDHKVMAITARGAWEAVKRHFREAGKDIQAEPFTVIGVGDMSGDVFGNGMLLSKQTKLIAAFDHRHIFMDPDPDPAKSWKERQRLFGLPRSSWADYNPALISAGGGVFARSLKSVALSAQIRALIGTDEVAMTPTDLIKALLQAKIELLYLGGIGTYVKAADETHAQVGDRANDAVRIDAEALNCQVIGEGANLGLTQAARIRFAQAGGQINTDAIDNSAGVDCSDHEVNIKILTDMAQRAGHLDGAARNTLLASMTDAVAEHVLADNIGQTLALSLQQRSSRADLAAHEQFMAQLEAAGRLDRKVEGLPGSAAISLRAEQGLGLTRPELAVIMAYGKLELSAAIMESGVVDDPWFVQTLEAYFPPALLRFKAQMARHRLRPDIIATVLANEMVNRVGPSFAPRLMAATGVDAKALVLAFTAARQILGLDALWSQIASPDTRLGGPAQLALLDELALALRRQTYWLARRAGQSKSSVQALISAYAPAATAVSDEGFELLSEFERQAAHMRIQALTDQGAPKALAKTVCSLRNLTPVSDIADLARGPKWGWLHTARLYHQVGAQFGLDRLRAAAGSVKAEGPFERLAIRRLIEDLLGEQYELCGAIMGFAGHEQAADTLRSAQATVASWSALRIERVQKAQSSLAEIETASGPWTFAKLTLANSALREVLARG